MGHRKAATKVGMVMVLGLLVGVIGMAAPATAEAGCAVTAQGSGTGTVVTCCSGQGFVVNIDGENVKLVGLGPAWYWAAAEYARPKVGDEVAVVWNVVQCNTIEQNVLVSLDYTQDANTTPLILRDDNNVPLWKALNRQVKRQQRITRQNRIGQAQ